MKSRVLSLSAGMKGGTERLFRAPWLLLTLASLFWAGNTVAGRLAVGEISPMSLTLLRWIGVIAVLWPIYGAQVRAHWPLIRERFWHIAAMGALGFTGFNALFYVAAHFTSAVNLGILQGAIPVFVMAGAYLVLGTRATRLQILGAGATVLGVIVIATRGAPLNAFAEGVNGGDLAMLVGSLLYASYTIGLHDRPKVPGPVFFTVLAIVAALSAVPLQVAEIATTAWRAPTLTGLLVTAFVAIFPSCLAQLFFMRGVDLVGAGRAGVFINLVPLFSALFGVALLGEHFQPFHALSMVLVIGGIWLAQRRPTA